MKRLARHVATALLAAVLTACGPTPKEKQVIADLTAQMSPACVGRFVMMVPPQIDFYGSLTLYYGLDIDYKTVDVEIESLDSSPDVMRSQMDGMAKGIDQDDKNWVTKKSMLLDYKIVNDRMIYLRQQDAMESAAGSKHELHILVGKTQLVLKADSFEGVSGIQEFSPGFKVETPDQVAARLYKIAGEIRAYDTPEDADSGFCLGPVVIDSDNDEERTSMGWRGRKYPDLFINIYSKALVPEETRTPLLDLAAQVAGKSTSHVLRKGNIRFADMAGQEWLGEGDYEGYRLLYFRAQSMRPDPALTQPAMSLEMKTGGQLVRGPHAGAYVTSSMTPREATGLWDAMVSSIRARPNAVKRKTNN